MSAILLGLIIGSIFWKENIHTLPGMGSRSGQLFISSLLFAVSNAGGVVPQILAAKAAYRRERALQLYSNFWYNFSWGLAEVKNPYLMYFWLISRGERALLLP